MAKEYKAFTEEEKKKLREEYIYNVNQINNGILNEKKKIKLDLENLERRLNDPNEVKVYRLSKEINEKLDKKTKEEKRLVDTFGENKKNYLTRTFSYLLKPGDTEEERTYNDNLYKTYLENPHKVFMDSVKNTMSMNPSKYFEAVQNGDTVKELEFFEENLDKMKTGFALESEIRNNADVININGYHSGGIMLSDEFKQIYDQPYESAFILGGVGKKITVTSTNEYFTVPPLMEFDSKDLDLNKIDKDVQQKWFMMGAFNQDDDVIKALKNHPELEVGDNFFVSFKAIKTVGDKEVEVSLKEAILDDKDVKFIKRPQEEIDTLLNPIDKDYLKVINGEITQEEYDEIELKRFLDEVEDFVKNPSKYHKEAEPDFTKPFTDKEKKEFEKHYTENVEMYNKVLPENLKLTPDLEDLQNKLNDPKQVEIYRRSKFLNEKSEKQKALFSKYNSRMRISNADYPLTRNLTDFMRVDGSKESENFNQRFLRLYSKHPFEFGKAVLRGIYKADSTVLNSIFKDDYERCKDYCKNFEIAKLAFNEKQIHELMTNDGGLVEEFKNIDLSGLIQLEQDLGAGFNHLEQFFEMPKLSMEQMAYALNGQAPGYKNKEYSYYAQNQAVASDILNSREKLTPLKEKGLLDDKEPILAFKAIEIKDGKEKEIRLMEAAAKNDPNIKIVRRSEEEKEKILKFSNGDSKRELLKNINEPSAKDSLSVHLEAIDKYIEYANRAKNNDEKRFDKSYDALLGLNCINSAINYVNDKADVWFKNREQFLTLAKAYGFETDDKEIKKIDTIIDNKTLRKISLDFFDKIETIISLEEVLELRKEVKGNGMLEFERSNIHVLNDKVNEIKNNMPTNLSQEEKDEYIKALDNINAKVIRKIRDDFVEKAIDNDAKNRKRDAKSGLKEFADSLGISEKDKKIFLEQEKEWSESEMKFKLENAEHYETFANVYEKRPHLELSEDNRNNLKGLCKIVDETGIFKSFASGETGGKGYGFVTFFEMQNELNELLNKDTSSFTDEQKKEYAKEVIKKSNELNDIEAKYDKVLGYITKTFEMDKISTNENTYSGRPASDSARGLLEKWDNKNARPGVVLNGLAQLYGAAKNAGISVAEFIDNPEKGMKLFLENKMKEVSKPFILPKEGNSLGKRLARAATYDKDSYQALDMTLFAMARAAEFLFKVDPDKQKAVQNFQSEAIYSKGLAEMTNGAAEFLNVDQNSLEPQAKYENLINVLLFGDDAKENIFESCDGFYNTDFKKPFVPDHMEKYIQMIKNPGDALKNIEEILKDFIKESKLIAAEEDKLRETVNKNLYYTETIKPANVAVAGKVMLENMLKANNMTLEDIKDIDVRTRIQEYLDNPVKAVNNMFKDELGLDSKEIEELETETQNALQDYYEQKATMLEDAFTAKMKESTKNEISMYDVIDNHQIGFFEGLFNTKATKNYRNLVNAIAGLSNPQSEYFGKPEKVALAAQAYLNHKYKGGKTIDNLKGEAKERAIFCENLIKTYEKSFPVDAKLNLNNNVNVKVEKTNNQAEKVVNNIIENEKEIKKEDKVEVKEQTKEKVEVKEEVKTELKNQTIDEMLNKDDLFGQEKEEIKEIKKEDKVEVKEQIKENLPEFDAESIKNVSERESLSSIKSITEQISIDLDDDVQINFENNIDDKTKEIKKEDLKK